MASTISYSRAIFLTGLHAVFMVQGKKTLIVLLYGLAVAAVAIDAASIMAFLHHIQLDKPQTTPQSEVAFPPIEQVKFWFLVAAYMVFFISFYISFYQSLNFHAQSEDGMAGVEDDEGKVDGTSYIANK